MARGGQFDSDMSLTQRAYDCAYCEETTDSPVGSYCSTECKTADKGRNVLRHIQQDHRFCSSCYRPIKTVFRPDESITPELRKKALLIRESFIGFEDLTKYAEQGNYGIECTCGNLQHYHAEPILRDGAPYEWFLKLVIKELREEGQLEYTFTPYEFADVFYETGEFDYAVGCALE